MKRTLHTMRDVDAFARLEAYPDALATVEAALDAHNVTMAIHDGRAVPTEEAGYEDRRGPLGQE